MKLVIAVLLLIACCFPQLTFANDGFAALGVGGVTISKTDKIAIKNEVLDVSYDKIHVSYDFINESDEDEDVLVMFPLPDYSALPPETYILAQGQPADFTISVDGKPVAFKTQVKALLIDYEWKNNERIITKERDVTHILKGIGLSDQEIAFFPFNTKYVSGSNGSESGYKWPISDVLINNLSKAGLMNGGPSANGPEWENRIAYIWNQRFPAKTIVHIEHSYRPFISEGSVAGYSRLSNNAEFCLSQSQASNLIKLNNKKENRDSYGNVPGLNVKYILTTANSWKDGIRDFRLRIHAKSKNEIVSACFPAKIKRVSEKTYEVHIENFKPG